MAGDDGCARSQGKPGANQRTGGYDDELSFRGIVGGLATREPRLVSQ
jgi:hypothetical protein